MFGLLKRKNPFDKISVALYERCVEQARLEYFYTDLRVPDSFEGRLDILFLHLFMIQQRCIESADGAELLQALFDSTFQHIEMSLREMGVGDVGIPKRQKKMMLAYNGRMHAYQENYKQRQKFAEVLDRNIYDLAGDVPESVMSSLLDYIETNIEFLQNQDMAAISDGQIEFKNVSVD